MGLSLLSVYALGVDVWLRFLFLRAAERNVARGLSWVDVSWWSRGGGVRSFLQRRALYVSSRGRRVQNSSAQESRGGLSLSIRISVRRAPTRAPMPSHTAQPYMQRASSVRRERPRAIKHTNCSLETTPQQRHDPQIAFYTLNFGARCANVKRYELWRYEILHE